MRIVVLTTDTPHHAYFVRELGKEFPLEAAVVERKLLQASFETSHPFEIRRIEYERETFFRGNNVQINQVCRSFEVESCNDPTAIKLVRGLHPDVIIVFGTCKLSREVIGINREGIINLHGGDPEEYRGLDTHLWAIYHGDFGQLIATLHRLNEDLDDGEIICQAPIPTPPGTFLHELRRLNTEVCLQLILCALDMFQRNGSFISRPQKKRGRNYSFMPAALKDVCRIRFERYTGALNASN